MSIVDRPGFVWINEEFVPMKEAKIHCLTHTFHYGFGVLEGLRVYNTISNIPAIFKLTEHTDRLLRSSKILGLKSNYTRNILNEAQRQIVKKNQLNSGYIRPMIFSGAEHLALHLDNLSSHTMIAAWELGAYLANDSLTKGVKIATSSFVRNHINSTLCKAKTNGNYVNSILALQEARRHGYQEVLFLDHQGYVAEASGANIFMVYKNVLYTPKSSSIFEGITRETIFILANDLNLSVKERDMTRDDLYVADEVFLTGTAVEVTPVVEVDKRIINEGIPGDITKRLQESYLNHTQGKLRFRPEWLTFIT